MRRIGIAFITICILLFSSVTDASTTGGYREISYEQVRELMLESNTTLQGQMNALSKARKQYLDYLRAEDAKEKKKEEQKEKGEEVYFRWDELSILSKLRQEELVPLQMKQNRDALEESLKIASYQAEFNLRSSYVNLYSRFKTLETRKEALVTAEKEYLGKEKAYEMGLIGDLELQQAGQALLEQKVAVRKSEREYENAAREFNLYIGADIDIVYENVILSEKPRSAELARLETYLVRALENRSEITKIKRSLELNMLQKDIMDRSGAHKIYTSTATEYQTLLDNIAVLEIQLEGVKVTIEQEIRNAYAQVVAAVQSLETKSDLLALEEKRLADLKLLFEKGAVPESQVQRAETLVAQQRDDYKISVFNLNTMIMRLERASAAGPGYGGI